MNSPTNNGLISMDAEAEAKAVTSGFVESGKAVVLPGPPSRRKYKKHKSSHLPVEPQRAVHCQVSRWTGGELPEVASTVYPRPAGHRAAWLESIRTGLGHDIYLVEATTPGGVVGLLPLCLIKGPIFGKFLVSISYVNTGGVWAENESVAHELITAACNLADQLDVKYLELRHEAAVAHERINFQRTDKVHMRLPLPNSAKELLASFKSKVRSQIKRANDFDLQSQFGGRKLLDAFYKIFAINMRDLGTPVFSRKLFEQILLTFKSDAEVCVVSQKSRPVAAALLVHDCNITEVPSASCLRAFNKTNANMFMYWRMLEHSIDRGSRCFDFGRSSMDSGTYRFKTQWGAQSSPAFWQYYVRNGNPDDMRADSASKQQLVATWQRLPVWITNIAGPLIVRGIP